MPSILKTAVNNATQIGYIMPTYPNGLLEGARIMGSDGKQYILSNGKKHHYDHYYLSNVLGNVSPTVVSNNILNAIPDGENFNG